MSEIVAAATNLNTVFLQTARLFCWATGASMRAEITPAAIEKFCNVLTQIDARFGTNAAHFELSVEAATARAETSGPHRDKTTISRHRNRLPKISTVVLPRIEDRIRPEGLMEVLVTERGYIDGWAGHRGFLLVERQGLIQHGIVLATFDRTKERAPSAESLTHILIREAAQKLAGNLFVGRAFVAIRHGEDLRPIPGFWNARASRG